MKCAARLHLTQPTLSRASTSPESELKNALEVMQEALTNDAKIA